MQKCNLLASSVNRTGKTTKQLRSGVGNPLRNIVPTQREPTCCFPFRCWGRFVDSRSGRLRSVSSLTQVHHNLFENRHFLKQTERPSIWSHADTNIQFLAISSDCILQQDSFHLSLIEQSFQVNRHLIFSCRQTVSFLLQFPATN